MVETDETQIETENIQLAHIETSPVIPSSQGFEQGSKSGRDLLFGTQLSSDEEEPKRKRKSSRQLELASPENTVKSKRPPEKAKKRSEGIDLSFLRRARGKFPEIRSLTLVLTHVKTPPTLFWVNFFSLFLARH